MILQNAMWLHDTLTRRDLLQSRGGEARAAGWRAGAKGEKFLAGVLETPGATAANTPRIVLISKIIGH